MTCTNPHFAYLETNDDGSRKLRFIKRYQLAGIFGVSDEFKNSFMRIPCCKCDSCKMNSSSHWAARCLLESSMHEKNCFVTLTYRPADMARCCPHGSLNPKDLQDFWKRLRKAYPDAEISYFACGEYGSKSERPHFHAIIFNFDFDDKEIVKASKHGSKEYKLYSSSTLEKIWSHGICRIGDVNYESAGYVARYTLKKHYGKLADKFYNGRIPEFTRVSNKRPIAKEWLLKHVNEVYGNVAKWYELAQSPDGVPDKYFDLMDVVHLPNGRTVRPPKYFDVLLQRDFPEFAEAVKSHRLQYLQNKDPESFKRLDQLDNSMKKKIKKLKREFEEEDLNEVYYG